MFACASVLFGFAVVCAWTAWRSGRPEGRTSPWARRAASRMLGGSARNTGALWWGCAEFLLFAASAAGNGLARLDRSDVSGWFFTAASGLLLVAGMGAGVVALRKRSRGAGHDTSRPNAPG